MIGNSAAVGAEEIVGPAQASRREGCYARARIERRWSAGLGGASGTGEGRWGSWRLPGLMEGGDCFLSRHFLLRPD